MRTRENKATRSEIGLTAAFTAYFALTALLVTFMPVVTPALQDGFGLSASQIGLLTSVYLLGYALVEFPAGFAGLHWGGRVFAFSGALLVLGSLVFALGTSLPMFAAGRAIQGLGAGMVIVTGSPVLARGIRPHRLTWSWGIAGAGWGVGTIAGLVILPAVADAGGFRAVCLAVAGFSLACTIAVLVPKAVRARPAHGEEIKVRSYAQDVRGVTTHREVALLGLFNATNLAATVVVIVWTPVFLTEMRGASVAIGALVTAGLGLSQIAANPAGAWADAHLGRRRVIYWSQILLAASTLAIPLVPGIAPVLIVVLLNGFFDMTYFPSIFAAVPTVVKLRLVGIAAAWVSIVGMLSSVVFPWLFGALLDAGLGYVAGYGALAAFILVGAAGVRFFTWSKPKPD